MIRFKELPIDDTDIWEVTKVLKKKSLGIGTTVAQLEEEFADYVGSKYAVAVNCCTNALYLALMASAIYEQYVGIPSMMVPLVANEIIHAKYEPYFVDDVDWVGHSYQLEGTGIIDSAHEVKKLSRSDFDWIHCYSFYPTKPICSADGGMICTNNEEKVKWFRKARFFGRDNGDTKIKNSWEYKIDFPGWKMHMTDIQAAIALNQLHKFDDIDKRRGEILAKYNKTLELSNTSHYLYRINVESRDQFIRWMAKYNVECGVHFYPLHLMDAYKKYNCRGELPKTMKQYKTTVSLPFHDSLTDEDVTFICDLVKYWWEIQDSERVKLLESDSTDAEVKEAIMNDMRVA